MHHKTSLHALQKLYNTVSSTLCILTQCYQTQLIFCVKCLYDKMISRLCCCALFFQGSYTGGKSHAKRLVFVWFFSSLLRMSFRRHCDRLPTGRLSDQERAECSGAHRKERGEPHSNGIIGVEGVSGFSTNKCPV